MLTEIWKIDDNGSIQYVNCYTLEPKQALIAYKQQTEKHNYNTWDYPKDDLEIKKMKSGEFVYFTSKNTSIYTKQKYKKFAC